VAEHWGVGIFESDFALGLLRDYEKLRAEGLYASEAADQIFQALRFSVLSAEEDLALVVLAAAMLIHRELTQGWQEDGLEVLDHRGAGDELLWTTGQKDIFGEPEIDRPRQAVIVAFRALLLRYNVWRPATINEIYAHLPHYLHFTLPTQKTEEQNCLQCLAQSKGQTSERLDILNEVQEFLKTLPE
jgi:hypothetical protein